MMTFLLTADFVANAKLLDKQRLGKQRVEACQILDAILKGTGWANHPATKAWRPYVMALKYYTNCIINEWVSQGNNNNIPLFEITFPIVFPWWVFWDRLHQSHRAMLKRKDLFYANLSVDPEYMNYGYIWPHAISYYNRNSPLADITHPIPDHLIKSRFCTVPIKSGARKGLPCNKLIHDNTDYCGVHRPRST